MAKRKEVKTFYFMDTRDDAKSLEPFGIHNEDVAKAWTKDFNNGEGPFQPTNAPVFKQNYSELKKERLGQSVSVEPTVYDDMINDELKTELEARGVEYKAKATKTELIALLVDDDNK